MVSKYVPRVNQLDAIQLDGEICRIIEEQLNNIYKNLPVSANLFYDLIEKVLNLVFLFLFFSLAFSANTNQK